MRRDSPRRRGEANTTLHGTIGPRGGLALDRIAVTYRRAEAPQRLFDRRRACLRGETAGLPAMCRAKGLGASGGYRQDRKSVV